MSIFISLKVQFLHGGSLIHLSNDKFIRKFSFAAAMNGSRSSENISWNISQVAWLNASIRYKTNTSSFRKWTRHRNELKWPFWTSNFHESPRKRWICHTDDGQRAENLDLEFSVHYSAPTICFEMTHVISALSMLNLVMADSMPNYSHVPSFYWIIDNWTLWSPIACVTIEKHLIFPISH